MQKLVQVRKGDKFSVNEHVYKRINADLIKDVKLIWNSESPRSDDTWEGLAIQFNCEMGQSEFIEAIVALKPEEYWGFQDGYHLFWFD